MQALASLIEGYGAPYVFDRNLEQEGVLETLEYCAKVHVNRHVRAAGLLLFDTVVTGAALGMKDEEVEVSKKYENESRLPAPLFNSLLAILEATLSDNWSQVRMASSVLCRSFLLLHSSLPSKLPPFVQNKVTPVLPTFLTTTIFPKLIPNMCLNRFYLAEGVKLYSQETWRLCVKEEGVKVVANNARVVVS